MEWKINTEEVEAFEAHYHRLFQKQEQLLNKSPQSISVFQHVKEKLFEEWTYNSNGIDGNTISLKETRVILQDGMTVKGKSLQEHFELVNHHEAIEYLEALSNINYILTEKDILDVHGILMCKIEKEFAGRYRNGAVRIAGARFIPPNALKVKELMEALINHVFENPLQLNPIALSCIFHHRFLQIHPFFNGNGKTARLIMNLILMRSGFPPAILLKNDRKKYFDALDLADNSHYKKLILLVAQATERSLNFYSRAFPSTASDEEYRSISEIVTDSDMPYSQEYVSLLARRGKIDAYKIGRNWMTNKKAIKDYLNRKISD